MAFIIHLTILVLWTQREQHQAQRAQTICQEGPGLVRQGVVLFIHILTSNFRRVFLAVGIYYTFKGGGVVLGLIDFIDSRG